MSKPLLLIVTSILLSAGCIASGRVRYDAHVTTPELVYINPEVRVIADYREPVFFADNYYWRNDRGVWYRSPRHTNGWVRINVAPPAIRQIERPTAYIHYRSTAGSNRARGPVIRNHWSSDWQRRNRL